MDLFFGTVWFFFGEAILSYCETKRAAMCRKTNSSGALRSTLLSLRKKKDKRRKSYNYTVFPRDYSFFLYVRTQCSDF